LIALYCEEALKSANGRLLEKKITGNEKAKEDCRELLIKYGKDIEAFLCTSDALALGATQAVLGSGWMPGQDIYILGVGGTEEMLEQIYRGKCMGTVISDESTLAQQIAKIATALMENTEAEKRFYAGYLPITKENVSIFREGK
jgi:ABC-type sugar transport system substrate-binding protein